MAEASTRDELQRLEMALAPKTAGERLHRLYDLNRNVILGTLAVAAFFLFWEWLGTSGRVNPLFTSAPSRIYRAAAVMVRTGEIWQHMAVSGAEFAMGYGMSIVVGIPLGILIGWYKAAYAVTNPFLSALYATPRVALLPLIVIWVGLGIWSKVLIVFLGAVFPIIVTTMAAMQALDQAWLRMARAFEASDRDVFQTIALPASVPFILAGLRLGAGRALIGVVVGELYAANAGVGYLINVYGSTFQTDKLFVGIVIIALAGVLVVELLGTLERRFEAWRPHVSE